MHCLSNASSTAGLADERAAWDSKILSMCMSVPYAMAQAHARIYVYEVLLKHGYD